MTRRLLTIPISHFCEKARWALERAGLDYGVRLPQPDELPEPVAGEVRRFRAHPAGAYALELFRSER